MHICTQCSSDHLFEGILEESGKLIFVISDNPKPVSTNPSAVACEDCGFINLFYATSTSVRITFCKHYSANTEKH